MEKEYLNEEKFQQANNKVKWGGRIAIIIGLVMIICGLFVVKVPEMGETGWFESESTRMFLIFPGIFITLVGCMVRFVIANRRAILAYQLQQIRPLAEEGVEKATPVASKAAKEVAKGVTEGIKEGLKEEK